MGTTSPDGIFFPDGSYPSGWRQADQDQADTIQTALLPRAGRSFRVADAVARGALSSSYTLQVDDRAFQIDTAVTYRYDGATWKAWESDWITYSPSITGVTVGTGGSTAFKYKYVAGMVRVIGSIKLGSSGFSVGTQPRFTLPVTREALTHPYQMIPGGSMYDASVVVQRLSGVAAENTSVTEVRFYFVQASGGAYDWVTATAPWTWAATDAMFVDFTYPPA